MTRPRDAKRSSDRNGADEVERLELKISELAKKSGVPAATLKYYVREGLIVPARASRNMAHYDASALDRIRMIKELQRTRFLPLKVIKKLLDERPVAAPLADVETFLSRTLDDRSGMRSRAELVAAGVLDEHLEWLGAMGAIGTVPGPEGESYPPDDVELLRTMGAARKAGIDASMLPIEIIEAYIEALRALVKVELTMFREGVLPRVTGDPGPVVEAAAHLSEKLVVLLRRRLLVPTLRELSSEGGRARGARPGAKTSGAAARTPKRARKR